MCLTASSSRKNSAILVNDCNFTINVTQFTFKNLEMSPEVYDFSLYGYCGDGDNDFFAFL